MAVSPRFKAANGGAGWYQQSTSVQENLAMTLQRSVVFAEPVRTAIGTFGGSLKDVAAPNLGATAISAAVVHAGLGPDEVEMVAMGNVVQAGNKMNPALAVVLPNPSYHCCT
jgi:hypothetical protein